MYHCFSSELITDMRVPKILAKYQLLHEAEQLFSEIDLKMFGEMSSTSE